MRVSWLNLHLWIPQRDVRKLIYQLLDLLDRQMVRKAHGLPFKWSPEKIMIRIAEKGYLGILQWWWKVEYPRSLPYMISLIPAHAAKNGHLHILQWLYDICKLKDRDNICKYAAEGGHLNIILWARSKGFNCCSFASTEAAWAGHLHCLQWFFANGIAIDRNACMRGAKIRGHKHVIDWLNQKFGLP